jgi:HD-GYP domain-containing protein (c-di-GMP phosphodiesterase class II)
MEKPKKRAKILYTVLTVLLALSVLPVVIAGYQLAKLGQDTLRGNEQKAQLDGVTEKANQIKLYIYAYRDQVGAFARSLEIAGGLSLLEKGSEEEVKIRKNKLAETLNKDKNLCALVISPLDKDKLSFAPVALDSNQISQEELGPIVKEAFSFMKENSSLDYFVDKPMLIKSSTTTAIVLASPIISQIGETEGSTPKAEGFVLAVVNLEPVFSSITKNGDGLSATSELLKNGRTIFFVVNNDGKIIAHPDPQMIFSDESKSNLKIVEDWKVNPNSNVSTSFEIQAEGKNIPILGTYGTANIAIGKELGVMAMVNEDAAYPSIGQMYARTAYTSAITILLASIVGTFLAIRLTSPIETLATGAKAISAGDFARRIKVRTKNEIGELADDFNKMAEHIQQYINELRRAAEENRMLFIGTVRALAEAIDGKDAYTRGHSERVMKYSVLIAQHMKLNEEEIEDIRIAGILHDVGKIGIDDKILKKPAALTDDEYKIMKQHPQIGAKIMSEIPQMKRFIPGMFYHHECLDGKGYPLGLRGDQIPLMARIISVADVFDAMTTNRPYQRAMDTEVAVERIRTFVGTRYDGQVVEALVDALHSGRLDEVLKSYAATLDPVAR